MFFQTFYFFSLKNVGTLIVTSDPPYVGDRYDTSPPVEHPNNTFTVFLFYIGLAKSFKILTLASNRTEAKLVSDIMHYSTI
jgi:hypothetical protein